MDSPTQKAPVAETRPEYLPEYLRFPKTGSRCPVSSLARPYLYHLAKEKKIQTISLREPGRKHGVSLIVTESLLAYIRSNAGNAHREQEAVAS